MNFEGPKENMNYDDSFRRKYLLSKHGFDNAAEMEKYELVYFTNEEELKELKRVESILVYELVLGELSESEKMAFLDVTWIGELEEKIAKARALPIIELKEKLLELKKQ